MGEPAQGVRPGDHRRHPARRHDLHARPDPRAAHQLRHHRHVHDRRLRVADGAAGRLLPADPFTGEGASARLRHARHRRTVGALPQRRDLLRGAAGRHGARGQHLRRNAGTDHQQRLVLAPLHPDRGPDEQGRDPLAPGRPGTEVHLVHPQLPAQPQRSAGHQRRQPAGRGRRGMEPRHLPAAAAHPATARRAPRHTGQRVRHRLPYGRGPAPRHRRTQRRPLRDLLVDLGPAQRPAALDHDRPGRGVEQRLHPGVPAQAVEPQRLDRRRHHLVHHLHQHRRHELHPGRDRHLGRKP